MFLVVFQLCNNSSGWTAISNPLTEPEAVKLLNILPSWFTVSPCFTPAGVFAGEVPTFGTHQPLFVNLRIVESSDLTVLLRPRFRLVPGEVLVEIVGAVALEYDVNNEVRARSCAPFKPAFGLSAINTKRRNCERHFAYCQGRFRLVVFLIMVIY